jgi:hypothetical protein
MHGNDVHVVFGKRKLRTTDDSCKE